VGGDPADTVAGAAVTGTAATDWLCGGGVMTTGAGGCPPIGGKPVVGDGIAGAVGDGTGAASGIGCG
jgi:hypothetical protein